MSSHATTPSNPGKPLDLSKWRKLPYILAIAGAVLGVVGLFTDSKQFAYSYLLAFIYFFSICVGGLFLVLIHHLFDAAWSVPLRRVTEHISCLLFPTMLALFVPVLILAPQIYPWMNIDPHTDHALNAKQALLNKPTWYICSIGLFLLWGFLTHKLRRFSLAQDQDGAPQWTYKMRVFACIGMILFAFSVSLAIILWVKSIEYQWFSTMYGVYYFAESVWTTLATVYLLMLVLKKAGPLASVITPRQQHDLGVLWFAFTVFYAYIHFAQYFIIWNGNIPEETFWYLQRDQGSWHQIGLLLIFGHFFVPFLSLLRIDAKLNPLVITCLGIWALLMHFCDVSFNIMPPIHPDGFHLDWRDIVCLAFVGGVLAIVWIKYFTSYAPYPKKDPRLAEALGIHSPEPSTYTPARSEGRS